MRLSLKAIALAALASGGGASPLLAVHTYYVSPTGSDTTGTGAIGAPFASVSKVLSLSSSQFSAGDTVYLRGGTYNLSTTLTIGSSKSGTAANPLRLLAYENEAPVFDFSTQTTSGARGVVLNASYWTVQGLTIRNARDNGILIAGSNNTLDRLSVHHNQDSGVQLAGSGSLIPSNNLIRNVDSYSNYDPANHGENADGFAAKFRELGPGNVFVGNRAWGNSDDGWDFWAGANAVTVRDSWSFKNGFNTFGDTAFAGDGNGLKLGHDSGNHVIQNVMVYGNRLNGIDINGNATPDTTVSTPYVPINHSGVTIDNVTAYKNGVSNYYFDEQFAHLLRNDISLAGTSADVFAAGVVSDHDTWKAGYSVSASDFLSLDDSQLMGPRQADGSLPITNFLRLKPTSHLVDLGMNVGLPFNGAAPDLGAFETTPLLGDVNLDGVVDQLDLNLVNGHWQMTGVGYAMGDANRDGIVDQLDLNLVNGNWQQASAQRATVPEPSLLAMTGGIALMAMMRRRRRWP